MKDFRTKPFEIIGASFGLGSYEKGAAFGPHSYLSHGLLDALQSVRADTILGPILEPVYLASKPNASQVKFLPEFLDFHALLHREMSRIYEEGRRPLVLGGDHALAISTISAGAQWLRKNSGTKSTLGLLWVDTHSDIHTHESSFTKNLHGMPVRVLLNEGDPSLIDLNQGTPSILKENIVYIGLRDIDEPEKDFLRSSKIRYYTMRDIDARGIGAIVAEGLQYLQERVTGVVVSFDLDACDPFIAPGVGTPVRGGLTEREAHFIMEEIAKLPNLMSVELVELNPELDSKAVTVGLGVRLLMSALGKTII